jgi:hypothetical protein
MEPISNPNRSSSAEPTLAELESAACLPREPEPLESRPTDASPPSASAVELLVDRYSASTSAAPPEAFTDEGSAAKGAVHPGIALSVGGSFATGPGIALGAEASIGVVVDLSEPKISVFTSANWGTAVASGISAGVSGQLSLVKDVTKFWGSGAEHGLNLSPGGAALNYTTPSPGGPREFNGVTGSVGPSLGVDGHYFEGTTSERWSVSLREIKDALTRAASQSEPLCVGP